MDSEEYVVRTSQLDDEYLQEVSHCGVPFPQVWPLDKACARKKK
jgi:hypothetical protein